MSGNLFVFNCIGIPLKLCFNAALYIDVQDEPCLWFL